MLASAVIVELLFEFPLFTVGFGVGAAAFVSTFITTVLFAVFSILYFFKFEISTTTLAHSSLSPILTDVTPALLTLSVSPTPSNFIPAKSTTTLSGELNVKSE